jgi:hypothetical protein
MIYWLMMGSLLGKLLYYQYETGLNEGSIFLWSNFSMLLGTLLSVLILTSATAYFAKKTLF